MSIKLVKMKKSASLALNYLQSDYIVTLEMNIERLRVNN